MYCTTCSSVMKDEGWQKNAMRDTKFKLYSCPKKKCARYGFTVHGEIVAVTSKEELAENAALRADIDNRRVLRAAAAR